MRPDDDEDMSGNRKSLHMDDEEGGSRGGGAGSRKSERIKVVDTEDASRGPLSGCIRLADSSRIIQRLKVWIFVKFSYDYKLEIFLARLHLNSRLHGTVS